MTEGKLVSSDLLVQLLKNAIQGKSKVLVDGFPRNQENIDEWTKQIGDSANLKFVLFMNVDLETMKQRLLKRGEESGRADDNEATIQKRFDTFTNESMPIIEHYKKEGKVKEIDSGKSIEDVYADVKACFQ